MKFFPGNILKIVFFAFGFTAAITGVHAQEVLRIDSPTWSNRSGLESVFQGKVAGLKVKSWTGTPGSQSIINLRGLSLDPTDESTMPLFMINGVPVISSPSEITAINPLSYFSPEQIDRIEIITTADKLATYGVQAPNGAINIVTKEGETGPLHVAASSFAGTNFLGDFDYKKDAFYNFSTIARRDVYKGALFHQQNIIIDGGGNYGSYLFGLTNYSDQGILKDSRFNRQSLFFNAKYNITEKFTIQFYNNLALTGRDGRYAGEYDRNLILPVIADEKFFMDKKRNIALLSSINLAYRFSSDLKLSSLVGLSYEGARRDLYIPSNILNSKIYAYSAAYKRQLITINTTLDYQHNLSDRLKLNMTLGNEIRAIDSRLTSVDGKRALEDGGSNYVKVVTGYNANQTDAYSDHLQENLAAFYGVWGLNYRDELKLNFVLRADGSSLYKHKWELSPAVGAIYNLNKTLKFPLSINASVGRTGMLNTPEVYRGRLTEFGDYYGGNELGIGTMYQPFNDAKSVDVTQFDAGITSKISKMLTLSISYFSKQYSGFMYQRYLTNISGINYKYETGAKLGLSGVEVDLSGKLIDGKSFKWLYNLNFASYKNKIISLPDNIEKTSLVRYEALQKGDAITSIIAYENGQQKIIGNTEPDFWGGFSNTFRYKNISASVLLTYALGADVAAESFNSRYSEAVIGNDFPLKNAETPYYFIEEDQNENVIYQGIKSIEDGSFIRLSNAVLAYDLSSLINSNMTLSSIELFVRGDNLFTLTKYSGSNPEENVTGIRKHDLSYTGTPLPLSVALGLKLKF